MEDLRGEVIKTMGNPPNRKKSPINGRFIGKHNL
jgi:hypothetical protein